MLIGLQILLLPLVALIMQRLTDLIVSNYNKGYKMTPTAGLPPSPILKERASETDPPPPSSFAGAVLLNCNDEDVPRSSMCGNIGNLLFSPVTSISSYLFSYFSVEEKKDPFDSRFAKEENLTPQNTVPCSSLNLDGTSSRFWVSTGEGIEVLNLEKADSNIKKQIDMVCEKHNLNKNNLLLVPSLIKHPQPDGTYRKECAFSLLMKKDVTNITTVTILDELPDAINALLK